MNWMTSLLHGLVAAEPLLNLIALIAILKVGLSKRFPAMTFYLALRCVSDAALYFILNEHHFFAVSVHTQTLTYVYSYWICYTVGAFAIFFVLQEIFKTLMDPVPGLQRLGLLVFRWVSIASVVILLGMSVLPSHRYGSSDIFFAVIGAQMIRCVAMMEVCLLAYLALSVHSLGRSFRSTVFGLGLGFGLEAAGQLVCSMMYSKPGPVWSWANLFLEIGSTASIVIWTTYFLVPERLEERSPITLPVTSPLVRWNEIAGALGQRVPHVALGATSSAFFLQEVEQVVDKFLTKAV